MDEKVNSRKRLPIKIFFLLGWFFIFFVTPAWSAVFDALIISENVDLRQFANASSKRIGGLNKGDKVLRFKAAKYEHPTIFDKYLYWSLVQNYRTGALGWVSDEYLTEDVAASRAIEEDYERRSRLRNYLKVNTGEIKTDTFIGEEPELIAGKLIAGAKFDAGKFYFHAGDKVLIMWQRGAWYLVRTFRKRLGKNIDGWVHAGLVNIKPISELGLISPIKKPPKIGTKVFMYDSSRKAAKKELRRYYYDIVKDSDGIITIINHEGKSQNIKKFGDFKPKRESFSWDTVNNLPIDPLLLITSTEEKYFHDVNAFFLREPLYLILVFLSLYALVVFTTPLGRRYIIVFFVLFFSYGIVVGQTRDYSIHINSLESFRHYMDMLKIDGTGYFYPFNRPSFVYLDGWYAWKKVLHIGIYFLAVSFTVITVLRYSFYLLRWGYFVCANDPNYEEMKSKIARVGVALNEGVIMNDEKGREVNPDPKAEEIKIKDEKFEQVKGIFDDSNQKNKKPKVEVMTEKEHNQALTRKSERALRERAAHDMTNSHLSAAGKTEPTKWTWINKQRATRIDSMREMLAAKRGVVEEAIKMKRTTVEYYNTDALIETEKEIRDLEHEIIKEELKQRLENLKNQKSYEGSRPRRKTKEEKLEAGLSVLFSAVKSVCQVQKAEREIIADFTAQRDRGEMTEEEYEDACDFIRAKTQKILSDIEE